MRTRHTFGIQFILRMNKRKEDLAPIYARVTVDARRIEISLKRFIDPINWNSEKGIAKGTREQVKSLNLFLEQVKAKLLRCYDDLLLEDNLITAEAIKNKFLGIGESHHTLLELVQYHNTDLKGSLAPGTLKNYFTTHRYIIKFLKAQYKCSDISLFQITFKLIVDFECFLRKHRPVDHQNPLQNNGVMKHIERFRKIIHLGVRMGWLDKDPFANYRLKFEKVQREFLALEELNTIEHRIFEIPRLTWVRDLFVFSCYTGLAYIDVMKLTPEKITIGIDGARWLSTSRQKTSNCVRIPLLPKAIEIIDKY